MLDGQLGNCGRGERLERASDSTTHDPHLTSFVITDSVSCHIQHLPSPSVPHILFPPLDFSFVAPWQVLSLVSLSSCLFISYYNLQTSQ